MKGGLRLVKMSGAGNDFIVLGPEARRTIPEDGEVDWVQRVCRRGLSVGADGVLWVEPLGADRVAVRFRNPDGSEAFCGNGSRCAARFAHDRGFASRRMILATTIGELPAEILDDGVRVALPPPGAGAKATFDFDGVVLSGRSIFAGTPHWVAMIAGLPEAPLDRWAPAIRRDPRFGPQGTNVNLLEADGSDRLRLRTFEKGVERETLSCGSGAVAAAYFWRLSGGGVTIEVVPASGIPLEVAFPGPADRPTAAVLRGEARTIFEATLNGGATNGF